MCSFLCRYGAGFFPPTIFRLAVFKKVLRYPFPKQALVFTCLQYKSFENTVEKGEISPFPTVFSAFLKSSLPFLSISKCCLQSLTVWKSLKFAVCERGVAIAVLLSGSSSSSCKTLS